MSSQHSNYVWYASYGSNLFERRFLCYIKGGQPPGSTKTEVGARDASLPLRTSSVKLPFDLYFSGYSDRWGGGAAFVDTHKQEEAKTLGRMYLITKEQFIDVVKQENEFDDIVIQFDHVIENGSEILSDLPYGNILYAGEYEGSPIFTFTHYLDKSKQRITVPPKNYLNMLISGYKEAYSYTDKEIVDYLITKPGIEGHYSRDNLFEIVTR